MARTRSIRRAGSTLVAISASGAVVGAGVLGLGGVASAAFPNPQNGLIAFTSTRANGGPDNLFTVDPSKATGTAQSDQAATRPLTNTVSNDQGAFWSADGTSLVFFSDRTGTHQIWKVAASNLPAVQDTAGTSPGADGAVRYYADAGHDDTWPSVATDGRTIAFQQDNARVLVVDPTASTPVAIDVTRPGDAPAVNGRAVFDPVDSSKLVYANGQHHIILVSGIGGGSLSFTDLSAASQIGNAADEYPDWAPDGSRIVFDSTRTAAANEPSGAHQIYTFKADGSGIGAFFTDPSAAPTYTGYTDVQPAYSPDGARITFSRSNGGKDVYDASAPAGQGGAHAPSSSVRDLSLTSTGSPIDVEPDWQGVNAPPPVVPEVPLAAGLPVAAAVMMGGAFLALRRRPARQ